MDEAEDRIAGDPGVLSGDPVVAAGLLEYTKLKDEQVTRLDVRDHFLYATIAAIGAVGAIVLHDSDSWAALYAIPFITYVVGALHSANDQKVTEIGEYIRDNLSTRLAQRANCDSAELFVWESARLKIPGRAGKKLRERRMLVVVFILPSLCGAVGVYFLSPWSTIVSLVSTLPFLILALPTIQRLRADQETPV